MITFPLGLIFSFIVGIIIFALYNVITLPTDNFNFFTIDTLWAVARFTVVPSSSTGSNTAIGLIKPVLDAFHSISLIVVSANSSAHL